MPSVGQAGKGKKGGGKKMISRARHKKATPWAKNSRVSKTRVGEVRTTQPGKRRRKKKMHDTTKNSKQPEINFLKRFKSRYGFLEAKKRVGSG